MQKVISPLTYWQQQLHDAPAMLALPTDKQRQVVTKMQAATLTTFLPFGVDSTLSTGPNAHSHLLAAYVLLLMRHSQQNDIVLGVPIDKHLLPLRVKITPEISFTQLVAHISQTYAQTQANAVPLPILLTALKPVPDDHYAPLFQVNFADGAIPESADVHYYDLSLVVNREAEGWCCRWHYRADLFTEQHIQQLATHYEILLETVAQNTDTPVVNLSIIPAEEQELLLHTWNQTALDFPRDLCLPEWIAQQVAQTPHKTAVSDQNTTLSYAQLDKKSGQLAAYLRQQGVQAGVVVGFSQSRTVNILVTLLGILKAGGIYLPLALDLPVERLQFMLDDAHAKFLITESAHVHQFSEQIPTVQLDTQWAEIGVMEPLSDTNLSSDTTAYIIYTSGSTGVPKGVPISHRNLTNLLASMLQEPGMTADDKFLAITALSFDIMGYELYAPLLVGGEVFIAPSVMMQDGHLLSDRLAQGDITFLQATPVTWQMLLAAGWEGTPQLKMISCGEPLTRNLATQLLARGEALWNLYGPTEATIFATRHRVKQPEISQLTRDDLPIGRPVANTEVYILDEAQRLLPIGAVGELHIGGEGISCGYLYRDALTAERFVPHPFSEVPNAKLYRSGDLARYRADGIIEYLGRTDYQVKVHGFRIELGEIEGRLQELDKVQTAVATTWINPANNDKHLVAYFVAASTEEVDISHIRRELKTTLPSYMIPTILMQLPKLPTTPNGKVDRKALPSPQETRQTEKRPFVSPRNATEKQLADLWLAHFPVERVSVHNSFLDLGGHSLLATQFISHIQRLFGVRPTVSDLFNHDTIAELATLITTSNPTTYPLRIQPVARDGKLQLSLAQKRLWFFYKLNAQSAAYNEPIALRLRGPVNAQWLQQSLTDVVARHEVLRTTFYEEDDVYARVQEIDQLPLPSTDLRHLSVDEQEKEIVKRVQEEGKRPFTLTDEIPIRTQLLQLEADHAVLLLTIHHIATDLWSVELLIHEVTTIYRAYQAGNTPDLPDLPIQYSDYAAWQNSWLSDHQEGQLAYWQNTLTNNPEPLQLPTAKPRSEKQTDAGAGFAFQLPDNLSQQTDQFIQKEKVTLFMLLLAAYQALLHQYTQQTEINVGTPIANRHHADTEKLIGFFVNTIVINATITPEMTFLQLLHQVRQRALGAQDHQDLPFNKVVEAVQTKRNNNYSPLFQTFFTVQAVESHPNIPDVILELIPFKTQTAKYDLMLSLSEQNKQINGFIEYKTDLFSPEHIEQLSQHYVTFLASLLQQPDRPLAHIDIRTTAERIQQIEAATVPSTAQTTILEKFTEIVAKFGDNTAVSAPDSSLTYHQLHQQSNQVAHLLQQQAIQPGDVVAVYDSATPQMLTALLGVLKIGGVYLPLNKDEPKLWQEGALRSGQAKLLLHSQEAAVNDLNVCPQLVIETAASCPTANISTPAAGGVHLPYLDTYPTAELAQLATLYPIQAKNHVLQFAPFASHQATHEIFATLLNGSTLFMAPREQLTKLSTLYSLLKETQVDFVILPAVLLAALDPKRLPHLHTAVSLEADMSQAHWQKWAGRQRLHGHISAATLLPTILSYVEDEIDDWLTGTAVTSITIQNRQGQPSPTSVVGELHLGPNKIATGDSWRWLENGQIQFRQYSPTHTTTRGRYIQTTSIAETISQHPAIRECVVLPDNNPCEKRQLHAYLVVSRPLDTAQLTQFAQQRLPKQLVPTQFHTVEEIPMTTTGSINYLALQNRPPQETSLDKQADTRVAKKTELSARRQNLSAKQQALLNKWQQRKVEDTKNIQRILKRADDMPLLLSFAQQRLLFIDQLDPNQATYNIPLALRLDGHLDEAVLQTAVDTLFVRHSSLRTSFFYADDGQPYPQISNDTHLQITQLDLSHLAEDAREKEARARVQKETQRPFSLTNDRLIRITHLRLADQQHILVIVMHHIITDGWSMDIFIREILHLYTTQVQNLPSSLPELHIQYADFAAWQRDWLQGDVLAQQMAYWENELGEAPAVLALPTDLPRPKMQSTRGTTHIQLLPANLTQPLTQLSQTHNSTLFMTLLAAYNVLLTRYSQQDDMVVGTPIANRNHPEIENLIGFFVNMLPMRTRLEAEDSFVTLLEQVRQTALNAYNHQDIPFEQLVNSLQPIRDTSHSPIFQVSFALQNANAPLPSIDDGLTLTPLTAESTTAQYDLMLTVTETNNGLLCTWEYSTDLFLPETIARMHTHFDTLLQGIIQNPDTPLAELPILPEAEKQLLLHDWQGSEDTSIPQICLHEQFEEWAAKQPEATAVADSHTTLTYQELNGRANQLARLLIQQGVQPGDAVGIHMPASVPAIITILACHKARAAYVPFDPAYPTQRLQLMLNDTVAPVILTDSNLDHLETGRCTVWQWVDLQPQLDQQADTNLNLAYTPTDPAYIIYTSGSTGKPKGVVCGHTGVFNLLRSFDQWGELPPQAASSLWTSLNFDVSIYEIFTPLVRGGMLHIVPPEMRIEMHRLFVWLAAQQIASIYLPPFMVEPFAAWLREGHAYPALQRLLVGVEPLAEQTLVAIRRHIPKLTLINAYGPTEATICSTHYRVTSDSLRTGNAPIGRPLLNYQIYILDEVMQPVPIGVAGELYIGGIGLAHGYLNRPELTAERFVPHPFSDDPQASLYRTGDLARYLPDGNIMFIGRTDSQLKVRGFRIELGEIESHIQAQPGIAAAAVIPHTAPDGLITLVAHYTLEEDASSDQQTLRDALHRALPNYMVPSVWLPLEQMPRTPNDKIDRKALPLPNLEELERAVPFEAPRTPTEEQLHAIWQSLLEVSEISIHDSFFELGGHSLLATQLVLRIQKQLNVKLPLRDIFEQGTVAQLAHMIELDPLFTSIPVSFAQQRLLVIDQLAPNQATYNVPLALRLDGRLDETALQTAVDRLYIRHGSLRTSFFYAEDGQPYQQISTDTHLQIAQLDLSHMPEDVREKEARTWVQKETQRPFSLTSDRLIRIALVRLADQQHILIIVMHHIITDGWSLRIFTREFLQLYMALVYDLPSNLPELSMQYADFATWQRNWLQGDVLAQQFTYWENELAEAPTLLTLPTDLPRPKMQSSQGTIYSKHLPINFTQPLTRLSQTHNSTLFMTLLAAYNVLLARYSQQNDIVVGTPIANRHHPEIENLIGFFVNMLPLRTRINAKDTFVTLLDQVRQTAFSAYNHQDIPFEQVVNLLQPVRDTSHSPIFQVSFSLENADASLPPLADLTLIPLTVESTTTKYDLALTVTPTKNGLLCTWEFSTDLFLPETIARMHTHFDTLLQSIIQNPDTPVPNLPILPEAEKQLLLHEWQGPEDTTIPQICLHERFEEWAATQPEATAVSDGNITLSYQELNGRANQLARLLIQQGVQSGDVVGIHMPSNTPAIITILACHKARAAYVPFDPAYPTQRLQLMLNDTAAPVVLTDSSLDHLQTDHCTVLQWTAIQSQLDQQADTNLNLTYTPTNPAYIIYTSGSTGKPKGAVCGHTGVFNLMRSFDQWRELPPQTANSLWTSLNFDASIYEIFGSFINGGTLHIVPLDIRADAPRLFSWLSEQKIQNSYLPPFMVEPFLKWLQDNPQSSYLQRLLVGVEPLAEQTLVQIQQQIPDLVVVNGYGPTEATVVSIVYEVPSNSSRTGNAPIGRPLLNTQIYLLDGQMQPVPIGVAGEIYIGGLGLAYSYLNRPQVTAERFVPNPFVADPQARLYKTGDLARYLPDGNVQFIGRTDFQLKVRGFRIELGEIESHLLAQPGVASGVVMPHTAADGQTTLAAYYTLEENSSIDQQTLRNALHEVLPNYMVPSVWLQLEQMPRTPNDKIDRKALPLLNLEELERPVPFEAPRTPTEDQLHAIWHSLLEVPEISIHDNFFELGGHSLLATQLVSRIYEQFNIKLPLSDVFDQSSIAQMAQLIVGSQTEAEFSTIRLEDSTQLIPVSFAQQRLLVIDQLAPNQATYNIPLALRLDGRLDEAAFQTALDTLFTRHGSLRTSFSYTDDGQPYQIVSSESHLPITQLDMSNLAEDIREKEALSWVQEEVQRPFSLNQAPLIRISHIRLAEQQHILVIVMHHIITDGWSMDIFVREFLHLYTCLVQNQPSNLPEMPIQYTDFAAWQRNWLQGDVLAQQMAYWEAHLTDAPAVLALPTDLPRPKMQSTHGSTYTKRLPVKLTQPLTQLGQHTKSTLFMTLLAAYNVLLNRYSQQDDIVVGTPIANRNYPEIENLIGFFVNMLSLRTRIGENETFITLLNQVQQTALDAYDHQDIPFEQVVNNLQPIRDTSHSPIFQVSFSLENANAPLPQLNDLTLTPLMAESKTAKYDLTLTVTETNNSLLCTWEYSSDLFLPETIARMHMHYETLLQAIVTNPQQPIAKLPFLLKSEKQQMLYRWNDTKRPFPAQHLHQLISHQANQTPQRIAVSDGHTSLTYQQLETQSNQLAHHLLTLGVQPDTFVAISVDRTAQMLIGLLGILKSGGAYLPLDPTFPAQRIQFMLADAQAPLLITQTNIVDTLPSHNAQVICLDTVMPELADLPITLPETAVLPHHLAYIIYTSGSTGRPKGVQIRHDSVVNLMTGMQNKPGVAATDKLLAITTLSFDIATVELYLPLLVGAQVVIAPQSALTDPHQLIDLLQSEAITLMQATPATWQMLVTANWQGHPGLKMITGGEALSVALAQQLLERGQTLWNMYAPSETTTYSTIQPILAEELHPKQTIPIGRPLTNTQLYILDSNLQPVPVGVIGELYIGGSGVARGYLNQPDLTAECFITNPVTQDPSDRLYRTGDLASYRSDGAVNFLGRSDHQVKIRGFRVELGEIESRLQQHPDVAQAVVHPHQQQLVAYLIFEAEQTGDTDVSSAKLRTFIQEALPAYMVPHIFIPLDSFPLTPNGKVDRKALPALTGERDATTTYVAPSNPTELQLAEIWQTLLNVDTIGIHDSFFELGGHSLLATQLVSRIHKQFNIKLPLRDIFDQGTIVQLAQLIVDSKTQAEFPTIPQVDVTQPIPVSFAQQRLLVIDQLAPNQATYNIPLALRLDGRLDESALQTAVDSLYSRHGSLRTTFFYGEDGQPYQQIAEDTHLQITQLDLSHLPETVQEKDALAWVQEEVQRPFSLTTDPLIRVSHIRLADQQHILVIVIHHIITDGWSMDIFVREFLHLYLTQVQNLPSNLPEMRIQYADFAAWQRDWLQGDVLAQQMAYWQTHLAEAPTVLALPTDLPRPKMQSTRGNSQTELLPPHLTPALTELSQTHNSTLFMTLLAAYNVLLTRYSQQDDIVVGTPIANRNHPEIENLIGFFVNMLPLRTRLETEDTFVTLLAQVRQTALRCLQSSGHSL